MAPKAKKIEASTKTSEKGAADGATQSAPIASGDDNVVSKSASAHSDAAAPSDLPTSPSTLPSPHTTTQTIAAATSDAKRLEVDNLALRFDSVDSALSNGLIGRESLDIKNDDFEHQKSGGRPKRWVRKLVNAFAEDYLNEPEDTNKTQPEQKEYYARWQKQAHSSLFAIFKGKDTSHLEKCCWYLFDAIIKAHELGVLTMPANNWSPSKLKCSTRLATTVTIIEKYAPVRLDILRLWHIEEIAANPEAFVKRKLINCWNNLIRAQKYKTKKTSNAAAVQEAGEGEEAQSSADVEEGRDSRVASPSLPQGKDNNTVDGTSNGDNKGKVKAKAKRARSVTPEPRDTEANKKPTITRKRPAGNKAPVALEAKGLSGGRAASAVAEAEQTV